MTKEEAITRLKNMVWLYGSAEREQNIEAIDMAIEALSANYTTEKPNDAVEQKNDVVAEPTDLIRRADAIALLTKIVFDEPPYLDSETLCRLYAEEQINALPSADRPSGEWIIRENGNKECSLCGHERQDGWDYFCGYCGAKMGSDTR